MVQLIIFYCIFIAYMVFSVYYIRKHHKRYLTEDKSYIEEQLDIDFRSVSRMFMIITLIVVFICSELLLSVGGDGQITAAHIGISLASGTFIFFVFFLLWDISRPKIIEFFKKKYNIEMRKETVFGITVIVSISLVALLLLEAVLSVIALIVGGY